MTDQELSYQIYSEFKTSDWYVYWDKEYSFLKKYQLLVVWHVKEANSVNYDYVTLKALLKTNTAQNGLPFSANLSPKEIKEFVAICEEFCIDIDREFDTED